MFTGIIEQTGVLQQVLHEGSNRRFTMKAALAAELHIDQSLAHDGVCLTVVALADDSYDVVAVHETLVRSTMASWQQGRVVNLERCMRADARLDGHFVQGHVDATGVVHNIEDAQGSWLLRIHYLPQHAALLVEKGSVCVNGVSLTVFDVSQDAFSVAIIPYTYQHTNLGLLHPGQAVNLEFDILGKYIQRNLHLQQR